MRLLTRIVERRSFTAAAIDLDVPRSTATEAIRELEKRLGVKLLNRTTRVVTPTQDGENYYRRCLAILADVENAEAAFRLSSPSGLLRVNVHPVIARTFLIPRLSAFLEQHPELDIHLGEDDRLVDLVRDGIDCVIRSGDPTEQALVGRRLATLAEVTCASPQYLSSYGEPASLEQLDGHRMIGFWSSRKSEVLALEFQLGTERHYVRLPARVVVTAGDAMIQLALLGEGLIQVPHYRVAANIARGELLEVLPGFRPHPTPLFAMYVRNRQLSPRVRVFIDWTVEVFRSATM